MSENGMVTTSISVPQEWLEDLQAWANQEERVTPERTYPPGMGLKFLEPSQEAVETIIKTLSQELVSG